ncbi:hypothetical protein C8R42DRAFT_720501 [Lentinula raphanica]|nr:hypothetical protein C8R42DRAFT_720501 [Lentinula raphanica]
MPAPSKRQSVRRAFRRKPSNIKPLFQQCNRYNCPNPVKVYLCTGSNYAHHRGHWYESCANEAQLWDTHFVTWRTDIPPYQVDELIRHEVRGVLPVFSPTRKSKMSMQSLIEQCTEMQPFTAFPPSPTRMLDRPNQGHSPAKRARAELDTLFDFSEPMEITIPDRVFSEEEALQFAQRLDLAEEEQEMEANVVLQIEVLHDELIRQLKERPIVPTPASPPLPTLDLTCAPDATSTSAGSLPGSQDTIPREAHPLVDADLGALEAEPDLSLAEQFSWKIGQTEQRFVKGTLRKSCVGRGCFGKTGLKSNDNCSFKLCKGCCAMYQHEFSTACKEAGHKPFTKAGPTPSSSTGSTPMYTHTRPLQQLHYERRDQARIDHHERARILQNQESYANDVRKNVRIKFWDENGVMDMLTVENPTYPFFCIDGCSPAIREALGAAGGRLVRIFDPNVKTWVLEESSNKRFVHDGEIILVRAPSCGIAEGMKEAETEELNRRNPRKRKFDDDGDTPILSWPSTPSHIRHTGTTLVASSSHQHTPTATPTLPSIRELSNSPDLPSRITPDSRPSTPTPAPKKAKLIKPEERTEVIDLTLPNSRHGAWPWKLYQGMHDGFMRLERKGTKHSDVFPTTTNKTKSLARAAWAAGTSELKARFRNDPNSTWKAYVQAVKELHGGSVPSYNDTKKTKTGLSNVKEEQEVIELD